MGKIDPRIHIVLGSVVIISSLWQERMRFFIVFGIGFLIWGIIGIILKIVSKKKEQREEELTQRRDSRRQQQHQQNNQHQQNRQYNNNNNNNNNNNSSNNNISAYHSQQHNQQHTHDPKQHNRPTHHTHKRCPNCHAIIEKTYRFCPHCGYGV